MPITQLRGDSQSLLSTELNSLANNSNAAHSSSVSLTSAGYLDAEVELLVTFGTSPTANTPIYVWLLREIDGTNFEDGSSTVTPTRPPDIIYTVRAVTTAQRIVQTVYDIPPGTIKPLVRNAGTGQAFASSGNTLTIRPKTYQA